MALSRAEERLARLFPVAIGMPLEQAYDLIANQHELMLDRYEAALERIAAGERPDGTYNLSRKACEQIAKEALKQRGAAMEMAETTFGVFTEVTNAYSDEGYPSITLYTARGESEFGRSLSAYWSLTLEEAERLGMGLIEHVGRARQKAVERSGGPA